MAYGWRADLLPMQFVAWHITDFIFMQWCAHCFSLANQWFKYKPTIRPISNFSAARAFLSDLHVRVQTIKSVWDCAFLTNTQTRIYCLIGHLLVHVWNACPACNVIIESISHGKYKVFQLKSCNIEYLLLSCMLCALLWEYMIFKRFTSANVIEYDNLHLICIKCLHNSSWRL